MLGFFCTQSDCTCVLHCCTAAGGSTVWANQIPVPTTKTAFTVTVGAGGVGPGAKGGDSWFDSPSTLIARGGLGGTNSSGGEGGKPSAAASLPWWGGGWGGRGGDISWSFAEGMIAGGGAGAGGYNGGWLLRVGEDTGHMYL
jgi:hypothetical protein